jgi:hypothetical protein
VSAAASWGTGGLSVSRSNEEERNARACQIWPKIGSRMKKEMATGLGRKTRRVRAIQKNHARLALHQASRRDSAHRVV